jgi:hypothetical protein
MLIDTYNVKLDRVSNLMPDIRSRRDFLRVTERRIPKGYL